MRVAGGGRRRSGCPKAAGGPRRRRCRRAHRFGLAGPHSCAWRHRPARVATGSLLHIPPVTGLRPSSHGVSKVRDCASRPVGCATSTGSLSSTQTIRGLPHRGSTSRLIRPLGPRGGPWLPDPVSRSWPPRAAGCHPAAHAARVVSHDLSSSILSLSCRLVASCSRSQGCSGFGAVWLP